MREYSIIKGVALVLLCLGLSACGGKSITEGGAYTGPPCMDVLTLPQNLNFYASNAGGTRILLPTEDLKAPAMRQKEAHFRPWRLTRPALWIKKSLDKNFNMTVVKAYTNNGKPFPRNAWEAIVENSNKKGFGSNAGPAITLYHSNLRAMPTAMHWYREPRLPGEGYPFDYFQHTSIPPATPVYICNVSRDGQWMLVDGPVTAGWIPARDVARVDEAFMAEWQERPLAAVVQEGTLIGGTKGHIGTLLPLAASAPPGFGQALQVFYPKKDTSGRAKTEVALLNAGAAVVVPLPFSADAVAKIGNPMMGQAYGWGGLDEKRDCSALTRDLFTPFGIHLPRNSASQARMGTAVSLDNLSNREKQESIVRNAMPFRSLVWLRGHIGIYLGTYKGKPVMFHNMWGLRTKDASGGCDGRAIVGKAVVTTLQPGIERPDLCNTGSFLDRIERVVIIP